MSVAFPEKDAQGNSLITPQDSATTRVRFERHNEQIDTLERRDLFLLDFLSKFDALPIGAIMPTSIPYTADTMPDGWIWANGMAYGKYENSSNARPNLWNAIKNIPGAVISLAEYQRDYSSDAPTSTIPCGKYVDAGETDDYFYVPTLNNVFLLSVTSRNTTRNSGEYEPDSIAEHTHDITSYPVNGANLASTSDNIGVALTDKITDDFTSLKGNNYKSKHKYTSETNDGGTETKPKSISYQFMIKADFTSFDLANATETDCSSVGGYKPSITAPDNDNLAERLFPVPNPENGKIGTDWFDVTGLVSQVLDSGAESFVATVGINGILKANDITHNPEAIPSDNIPENIYATTIPGAPYSVPVSDTAGKIDPSYFYIVDSDQISTLF